MQKHFAICFLIGSISVAGVARAEDGSLPRHLGEARELLKRIDLRHTSYEHGPPVVVWSGTCESHADCSGFVDALLAHSYGYDADAYHRWLHSHRPSARRFHDAIVEHVGFTEIKHIKNLHPGDFLVVKYLEQKENTGHIMLASGSPQRMHAKKPHIDGTDQWEVNVIDSSKSGHGPTDSRHAKGRDGHDHDGLGEGVLRLYATREGTVAGFTWSTLSSSEFKSPKTDHLVMGRLKPGFMP